MIRYGGADGAHFRVEKSKDSPTIVSNFYIMWGKFEVTMKASPGAGIVSSIVLQSEDLDEIDWVRLSKPVKHLGIVANVVRVLGVAWWNAWRSPIQLLRQR